jgi:pilus assembly protein CpaE
VAAILLVGADTAAAESIAGIVVPAGHTLTTLGEADDAFSRASEHQVVIIDSPSASQSAVDLCREIRSTPTLAAVAVLAIAASDAIEDRINFLEAGADDVIARPYDDRELEARVEALVLRFARTKESGSLIGLGEGAVPGGGRHRIVVFSPKGGAGTTTLAVNIAMAIARAEPDKVCLIDLDLQFGQALTLLNLEERLSLADLVRDPPALAEAELMRTFAVRHDSGLHVLAAPSSIELAEVVTAEHVEAILRTITGTYDRVVIDAGSQVDERVLGAFEQADLIVFAVTPDFPTLRAVHALLDYLNDIGTLGAKCIFVLNHIFERQVLRPRDIEGALGAKLAHEVPHDAFLFLKAVNEGNPIVAGAPRSAPAESLAALARSVFGMDAARPAAAAESEKKRGIFGLRR